MKKVGAARLQPGGGRSGKTCEQRRGQSGWRRAAQDGRLSLGRYRAERGRWRVAQPSAVYRQPPFWRRGQAAALRQPWPGSPLQVGGETAQRGSEQLCQVRRSHLAPPTSFSAGGLLRLWRPLPVRTQRKSRPRQAARALGDGGLRPAGGAAAEAVRRSAQLRPRRSTHPRAFRPLSSRQVFEYWLHPTRYRTQLCNDGSNCKRKICFFAHRWAPQGGCARAPQPAAAPCSTCGRRAHASGSPGRLLLAPMRLRTRSLSLLTAAWMSCACPPASLLSAQRRWPAPPPPPLRTPKPSARRPPWGPPCLPLPRCRRRRSAPPWMPCVRRRQRPAHASLAPAWPAPPRPPPPTNLLPRWGPPLPTPRCTRRCSSFRAPASAPRYAHRQGRREGDVQEWAGRRVLPVRRARLQPALREHRPGLSSFA